MSPQAVYTYTDHNRLIHTHSRSKQFTPGERRRFQQQSANADNHQKNNGIHRRLGMGRTRHEHSPLTGKRAPGNGCGNCGRDRLPSVPARWSDASSKKRVFGLLRSGGLDCATPKSTRYLPLPFSQLATHRKRERERSGESFARYVRHIRAWALGPGRGRGPARFTSPLRRRPRPRPPACPRNTSPTWRRAGVGLLDGFRSLRTGRRYSRRYS